MLGPRDRENPMRETTANRAPTGAPGTPQKLPGNLPDPLSEPEAAPPGPGARIPRPAQAEPHPSW